MSEVRATFLAIVDVAVALVHDPALDAHWSAPSALEGYDCGALAGHLLRGLRTVDTYLDDLVDASARLVELCVHTDDLAVSIGVASPALPDDAARRAVALCAELARRRHGDAALLRALTRAERAPTSIAAF